MSEPRRSQRFFPLVLGAAVVLSFVLAVLYVFGLRANVGDALPAYSTLRPDPLGGKAFYESLATTPGLTVSRHYDSPGKLDVTRGDTVFFTGVRLYGDLNKLEADVAREFDEMLYGGARIVLALYPAVRDPRFNIWTGMGEPDPEPPAEPDAEEPAESGADNAGPEDQDASQPDPPGDPAAEDGDDDGDDGVPEFMRVPTVHLGDHWGFTLDFAPLTPSPDNESFLPATAVRAADAPFAEELPWMSGLYIDYAAEDWRVLYRRGEDPVAIERRFGDGALIVLTDTSLLSNQGLREWPAPALLAYLVGPNSRIVFDEFLKGVQRRHGVMSLARRYRLHGFLAALLVVAALLIWRNASSLVPAYSEFEAVSRRQTQEGRSAAAGLTNLLRRSVRRPDLLATCFQEWRRSAPARPGLDRRAAEAEEVLRTHPATRESEILAAYRAITRALRTRR